MVPDVQTLTGILSISLQHMKFTQLSVREPCHFSSWSYASQLWTCTKLKITVISSPPRNWIWGLTWPMCRPIWLKVYPTSIELIGAICSFLAPWGISLQQWGPWDSRHVEVRQVWPRYMIIICSKSCPLYQVDVIFVELGCQQQEGS